MYAFEKLGYLVTEANLHLWTQDELDAWEDALDEYAALVADEGAPEANGAEPNGAA